MKTSTITSISLLSAITLTAAFIPPFILKDLKRHPLPNSDNDNTYRNQIPMNPGPVTPNTPSSDRDNNQKQPSDSNDNLLTISDILPKTRSINIFASLTRDVSSVSSRLETSGSTASNTTLLAPLNSAMQALPRKPWEDRPDDTSAIRAERNEDKAAENLQKFVEEHVVPVSPWKEGKENKVQTLGGREVWWEFRGEGKDRTRVVMPGEVVVDGIVGRVGNGEIWAVRGVVNY